MQRPHMPTLCVALGVTLVLLCLYHFTLGRNT